MLPRKKIRQRREQTLKKYKIGDLVLIRDVRTGEPIVGMIVEVGTILYRIEWYGKYGELNLMHYAQQAVDHFRQAYNEYLANSNTDTSDW